MSNKKFTPLEMYELAKRYLVELGLKPYAMYALDAEDGVPLYINNSKTEMSISGYFQAIHEIPDYCGLPYFATINNIAGFDMLTVLCVSPYREDEEYNLQHSVKDVYLANAYVINLDESSLSEAGTVTIEVDRRNQTLRRIW